MAEKLKNANVTSIKEGRAKAKAPPLPTDEPPAPIGDNSLTPEQEARALRLHHVSKLRAHKRLVDKAKEALDVVKGEFSDLMKLAKLDTKIDRKQFTEILADMSTSRKDLEAAEKTRALLRADWDLPVGFQADLFAGLPDEARDTEWAKGVGYAMGLRGDPLEAPEGMEPRFDSALMAGYQKGQEELIWANAAAGRHTERKKSAASTGPTAAEIARQPEPGADDPRETLPPSEFESEDEGSAAL